MASANQNIISELATLKEQVRLKNEQNDKDHTEIKSQLKDMNFKLNKVIVDHEQRLNKVEEIVTPMVDFRDKTYKRIVQYALMGGIAVLAIMLIVSKSWN